MSYINGYEGVDYYTLEVSISGAVGLLGQTELVEASHIRTIFSFLLHIVQRNTSEMKQSQLNDIL